MRAGVDRFKKFGSFATMDRLAEGDVLKYSDILNVSYSTVFAKLLLDKNKAEYEKKLRSVMSKK